MNDDHNLTENSFVVSFHIHFTDLIHLYVDMAQLAIIELSVTFLLMIWHDPQPVHTVCEYFTPHVSTNKSTKMKRAKKLSKYVLFISIAYNNCLCFCLFFISNVQ